MEWCLSGSEIALLHKKSKGDNWVKYALCHSICTYEIVIMSLLYHRLIKWSFVFVGYYRAIAAIVAIVELGFTQHMMPVSIGCRWFIGRFVVRVLVTNATAAAADATTTRSWLNICISWTTIRICRRILRCCIGCIRCTCIIVIQINVTVSKITVSQWTGPDPVLQEWKTNNTYWNRFGWQKRILCKFNPFSSRFSFTHVIPPTNWMYFPPLI